VQPDHFEVTISYSGDAAIFRARGELDIATEARLKTAVDDLVREPTASISSSSTSEPSRSLIHRAFDACSTLNAQHPTRQSSWSSCRPPGTPST
jgi:hypothetical protein